MKNITDILSEVERCAKCETIRFHKKFPRDAHGKTDSDYMIVSEAPGRKSLSHKNEAEEGGEGGKYWMGSSGMLLRNCLEIAVNELAETEYQTDNGEFKKNKGLEDLFYLTDIVKCWPNKLKKKDNLDEADMENYKNRSPSAKEENFCSPYLNEEVKLQKPKLILSFGLKPARFFINSKKIRMAELHGNKRSFDTAEVLIMYHPGYICRHSDDNKQDIYEKQLINVFKKILKNQTDDIEEAFPANDCAKSR